MLRSKLLRCAGGERDLFQISRVNSFTDISGNATVNLTGLDIRSGDLVVLAVMGADSGNGLADKLSSVSVSIDGTTTQTETQRAEDTYNGGRNACLMCDCIASTDGSSIEWTVTRSAGVAGDFGSAACVVVASDVASSLGLGLTFAAEDNTSSAAQSTRSVSVSSLDTSESLFVGFGFEEGSRTGFGWDTITEDLTDSGTQGCVACGRATGTGAQAFTLTLSGVAPMSVLAAVYD